MKLTNNAKSGFLYKFFFEKYLTNKYLFDFSELNKKYPGFNFNIKSISENGFAKVFVDNKLIYKKKLEYITEEDYYTTVPKFVEDYIISTGLDFEKNKELMSKLKKITGKEFFTEISGVVIGHTYPYHKSRFFTTDTNQDILEKMIEIEFKKSIEFTDEDFNEIELEEKGIKSIKLSKKCVELFLDKNMLNKINKKIYFIKNNASIIYKSNKRVIFVEQNILFDKDDVFLKIGNLFVNKHYDNNILTGRLTEFLTFEGLTHPDYIFIKESFFKSIKNEPVILPDEKKFDKKNYIKLIETKKDNSKKYYIILDNKKRIHCVDEFGKQISLRKYRKKEPI